MLAMTMQFIQNTSNQIFCYLGQSVLLHDALIQYVMDEEFVYNHFNNRKKVCQCTAIMQVWQKRMII